MKHLSEDDFSLWQGERFHQYFNGPAHKCVRALLCVFLHVLWCTKALTWIDRNLIFPKKTTIKTKTLYFQIHTHISLFFLLYWLIIEMSVSLQSTLLVTQPCHATTHSRAPFFLIPPSLSSSSPFIFLLDGCCKLLSSEYFQLSHFFRVHDAGFSPLHQIFIEEETGEAGLPRAFLSTTHMNYNPLFWCPLNLPDSISLPVLLAIPCWLESLDTPEGTNMESKEKDKDKLLKCWF